MLYTSYVSQPYTDPVNSVTYAFGTINGMIIDDVDKNGFVDLITFPSNFTTYPQMSPVVWTNTGGVFTANLSVIQNIGTFQFVRDSMAGDFNNDGFTDYFQADQGFELNNRDPAAYMFYFPILMLGTANGLQWMNLSTWLTASDGGRTFNHIGDTADFDGDGDLDVAIATFWKFKLYENDGNAHFTWREDLTPASLNDSASGTSFINLGGKIALVVGSYQMSTPTALNAPPPAVLTQQGGKFVVSYSLTKPELGGRERNYGAVDMYNVDLNGDGREDLMMLWETEARGGIDDGLSNMSGDPNTRRYADLGNTIATVWFQDATGKLVRDPSGAVYNVGSINPASTSHFIDFNGDGNVDFWNDTHGINPANFDDLVWLNDGSGHFSHPAVKMFEVRETFPDWYKVIPRFIDANNDGIIDVVATRSVYGNNDFTKNIGEEVQVFLSDSLNTVRLFSNGNDRLISSAGDDRLMGGDGVDTAIYSGNRADFRVTKTTTGFTIMGGAEGTDTLINVERLQFSNTNVALDLGGNAGTTAKLLGAVFGAASVSNKEYVGIGLSLLDGGMSYAALMQVALNAKLGAGFSDTAEINLLYQNLVGTLPSAADLSYLRGMLTSGQFSQASLAVFAADHSLNAANINLVGLQNTGIEYVSA